MNKTLSVVAALALLAAPVAAQDATAPASLRKGATSVTFALDGSNGGSVGLWAMVGSRHNLGLTAALNAASNTYGDTEQEYDTKSVQLGLASRHYLGQPRSVTPYLELGVGVGLQRDESTEALEPNRSIDGLLLGARGSIGMEWFPSERVSFGASGGLRYDHFRAENTEDVQVSKYDAVATYTTVGMRIFV